MRRLADAGVIVALLRLAAVAVLVSAERLVEHPAARSEPFDALAVAAGVYALGALAGALWRSGPRPSPMALGVADVAFVLALVYTSGGPFSQLRFALFLVPILAALMLRPALTAGASAATIVGYLAIALLYPGPEEAEALDFEVTQVLFLALTGAAATAVSGLLARRDRETAALAESRGRLVAQALHAEDQARRRLAEELHDEAIQNLLAARHELRSLNGRAEELGFVQEGLDRTVKQLREAVFDLHPYLLEHGGLGAALRAVAERQARLGGFEASVTVDPGAEGTEHDQLVFSLARELLTNVAKHARAGRAELSLRRRDAGLELVVGDDGRGLEEGAAPERPEEGHIGLASCAERAQAVGGGLSAGSGPGGGTRVSVNLPLAARVQ